MKQHAGEWSGEKAQVTEMNEKERKKKSKFLSRISGDSDPQLHLHELN
jgi:hypothetical protein